MIKKIDLMRLLSNRRSLRQFAATPISEGLLIELVKAAGTAPSSSNKQPWRFIVVRNPTIIAQAAEKVEAAYQNLMDKVNPEFHTDLETYSQHFLHFRHAPVVIVPIYRDYIGFSHTIDSTLHPQAHAQMLQIEQHSTLISISLAIENLLLAAESLGIGTCCMTGPLIASDQLRSIFKVPDEWQITMLIPAGYPLESPQAPGRKEVTTILKWL